MDNRVYLLSVVCGILSEVFLFSKGEWDRHSPAIFFASILLSMADICLLMVNFGLNLLTATRATLNFNIAFLAGLFSAMMVYRLVFHPLRSFPGPFAARISSFWILKENVPDLRFYVRLRELHKHYGDFIRIRPREISICHPDAVVDVHGSKNKIRKGEFYEQLYPHQSLQMTRNSVFHKGKRRHWDKAFQTKSLNEYLPRIKSHYIVLMDILARHATTRALINIDKSFMDLGFDIVSELTFGKSFRMLPTGEPHEIIKEFLEQKKAVGFVIIILWVFGSVNSYPWLKGIPMQISLEEYTDLTFYTSPPTEMLTWCSTTNNLLDHMMKQESSDFYTYLSQAERFEFDRSHEAQLAIVAGADTVAITQSNIFYLLCQYPRCQAKLREEICGLPAINGVIDDHHLIGKPYLHGVINEALRLYPPVPSGVQRLTPPEGAVIAGRYVPGDMIVTTPTYALQRDERAFVNPEEFIPERWSSQPELILRKDAFIPFSYGIYNCAGRPFAMMELRMVISMILKRFDISFPPDRTIECQRYIKDQADCFVMHTHPLPIFLEERVKSG